MRLKRNRLKECSHRRAMTVKDSEGVAAVTYGPPALFQAEVWPGGGKLQAERYGIRLPNIRNLRLEGRYCEKAEGNEVRYVFEDGLSVSVNDGIGLYADPDAEPDYRVVAVYPYSYLVLEVERRIGAGMG